MNTTKGYRYGLDGSNGEKRGRKVDCPVCGGKRSLVLYRDYATGEYIDKSVGKCDHANKCGYHKTPKEWFALHAEYRPKKVDNFTPVVKPKALIHIPFDILDRTLEDHRGNSFIDALLRFFPVREVERVVGDYYLGTTDTLTGKNKSVCFWFIDQFFNIRAGQVKEFDHFCKTLPFTIGDTLLKAYWIHRVEKRRLKQQGLPIPQWLIEYEQSEKVTCLFGEHLISKYSSKPIALVEAPKSAVIGSIMYPDYVWLATSSLTYLTEQRCKVLAGRKVVLFPDCGIPNPKTGLTCLEQWRERVDTFAVSAFFAFSAVLEESATEEQRQSGFDIADLILSQPGCTPLNIELEDIKAMPVTTKTHFGNLILSTLWLKDGRIVDVLFDGDGEFITSHKSIKPLEQFFGKSFRLGKLNGIESLIHVN